MNKLLLFIIVIFVGCKQQEESKPFVVASATKTKTLYIGINNPISVAVSGVPYNKLKLKVDDSLGTIKGDSGKYVASVKSLNYKIQVYKIEDDKEVFLDTLKFKIKNVPIPPASILGYSGECTLSKEELLTAKEIKAELSDFIFDMKFPVVSFNFGKMVNGLFVSITEKSSKINEQMKSFITNSKSGDKILIEFVKIYTPQGIENVSGILIKIK